MIWVELSLVAVLVLLNGLLAMSELAVVSSRVPRLKSMAERGVPGAKAAVALAMEPGRFLSSVQVGITLVGIVAGAFSGASLGTRMARWLTELGVAARIAEPVALTVVVSVITYFSIVVGELVPKQIALRNAEGIACLVAKPMTILAAIVSPFVWLLDRSGRLLLFIFGFKESSEATVTDEEIKSLIAEAETAGVIESGERDMIRGVMRLGDRPVRAVMTPLPDLDVVDLTESPQSIARKITSSIHSRLPAHEGQPDQAIGIIQVKDIADLLLSKRKFDIRKLVKKAPVIPDSMPAIDVVELLRENPIHMGFVQDEYGRLLGIVTASDLLESITGGFQTEEESEPHAVQREDGSWLVSGRMPVDELADLTGIKLPEKRRYSTVAGFVLDGVKHLPMLGESFRSQGWRFEVLDLDGRRIDKVLAARLSSTHRQVQGKVSGKS